jgi:iron complex transport system ATP-binding protein
MGDIAEPEIFRIILMERSSEEILFLDSLKIGYVSGRRRELLLPPLTASAKKGEIIAVIGRNGIGKSTLLRTLTGLQPSLDGNILYGGKNIKDFSRMELALKVGYISTESVKVSNMSVYDLVALGRFPHTNWIGKIDHENHKFISDSIEKTGMSALSGRFVAELSDGERQKAMIARILAQDTGIMIMDEPTAFLDVGSKYEIFHLMHMLSHKNEKTIIFSTHDLDMALSQSDKIWLILDDRLVEGAPEDLMIEREFDHLFNSSIIQFNSDRGTFSFRGEESGKIYVEGEGVLKYWTEKAINRAGISVSDTETIPYIKVPSGDSSKWQIINNDSILESGTIYDLLSRLGKTDTDTI